MNNYFIIIDKLKGAMSLWGSHVFCVLGRVFTQFDPDISGENHEILLFSVKHQEKTWHREIYNEGIQKLHKITMMMTAMELNYPFIGKH